MAKSYKDLWSEAAALEKEGESVANFKESATKLPFELKDAFRKAQDPGLDKAINKAAQDTFNSPFAALDKYQNIENPFTRRSLAEKYQSTFTQNWQNLLDEKTRRQGVFADYIDKWTGLFGAEAARRQDAFNNKMTIWDREKSLADTEEGNRRWEIENARAERRSAKEDATLNDSQARKMASNLKNQGWTWQDINDYLVDQYGYDTTKGSSGDNMLRGIFGFDPIQNSVRTGTETETVKKGSKTTVTQRYLYNE